MISSSGPTRSRAPRSLAILILSRILSKLPISHASTGQRRIAQAVQQRRSIVWSLPSKSSDHWFRLHVAVSRPEQRGEDEGEKQVSNQVWEGRYGQKSRLTDIDQVTHGRRCTKSWLQLAAATTSSYEVVQGQEMFAHLSTFLEFVRVRSSLGGIQCGELSDARNAHSKNGSDEAARRCRNECFGVKFQIETTVNGSPFSVANAANAASRTCPRYSPTRLPPSGEMNSRYNSLCSSATMFARSSARERFLLLESHKSARIDQHRTNRKNGRNSRRN